MLMRKTNCILTILLCFVFYVHGQKSSFTFRIRTITAGVTLKNLSDTQSLNQAASFLKQAKKEFTDAGYEVQTLRIATSNLYTYLNNYSLKDALPFLQAFDDIAVKNGISAFSIGQVLTPQDYREGIGEWAALLARNTKTIS